MREYTHLLFLGILFIATACSPKVSKTITSSYAPLDYKEEVLVLDIQTPVPNAAENLGTVKIGDTGFSTDCDWNTVIEKAKMEARKVGGNVIKITEHKPPTALGSSCHRITVAILRVENVENVENYAMANTSNDLRNANKIIFPIQADIR